MGAIDVQGSDVDAEHGRDDGVEVQIPARRQNAPVTEAEGSDVDAEGEEVDDEEDDSAPVGVVKARQRNTAMDEEKDAAVESSDAKSSDSEENDSSSSSESEGENEWEAESDTGGGAEAEVVDPNRCM